MAITNNGTKNTIPDNQIPSGYTRPTVTELATVLYTRNLVLEVDKATVHNATAATTMANIIANATIGITKQIDDIMAKEFDPTETITLYSNFKALTNNFASLAGDQDYLTSALAKYICTVDLFIYIAP